MKKLLCLFAVIALTAPAFADVEIICTDNGGGSVTVSYVADTEAELVRAFALDISVDAGTITGISNFKTGESTQADPGYGIFMTSIDLTDPENPVWNTPVADPVDPEDNPYTCGGLGDSCITVELGSLYDVAVPNDSPLTSGDLFDLTVSETCNMSIDINADIGGIVMEGDPPAAPATIISTGCSITVGPGECYVLGAQRGTCNNYNYGNQLITQAQVDAWNAAGQPDAWCCPCQPCGDADNSGGVTAGDYFAIFSALGNPASLNPQEDVDHSGSVTAGDYFIVFENLGLSCGAVCPPL